MEIQIIAGTCIFKGNRILLLKQSDTQTGGTSSGWGPPAGHGELKETLAETAKRETKEESNLDVNLTGIVECGLFRVSGGKTYLIIIFSAKAINIENLKVDNNEISEFMWADLGDLKSGSLILRHPILKPILIKALENKPFPLDTFKDMEISV